MKSAGGSVTRENGTTIAYHGSPGKNPGVLFVHGLRSDMNGSKAQALQAHCLGTGRAFLRFDLSGHGRSSGRFEEGTIGAWRDDLLAVLDEVTEGPQILVGSSLGGWLMLLAALARPDRVAALLGLAAAPDFTEDLLLPAFSAEQRAQLRAEGAVPIEDCYGGAPYSISQSLIEDGRRHLVLRGPVAVSCPVTLIHGQRDADVPWQTAVTLAERLQSEKVRVILLKSAGHRLSEPDELALITTMLDSLLVE
jgi:pimeloyl-ACP methyl ester carboxylesterase